MTNTPAETVERLQWPPSEEQLNEWLAQIVEVFWSASSANFIRAGKLRVEDIKAKYVLREIIRPFAALTAPAPSASVAGEAMREACAQAAYRWWDGEPEDAEDLRATIRAVPLAALQAKPDEVTVPDGETGWLIEWPATRQMPLRYWHPIEGHVIDPNHALRFARREDADLMRQHAKLQGARAVEHMWLASLAPKPDEVTVVETRATLPAGTCSREYLEGWADGQADLLGAQSKPSTDQAKAEGAFRNDDGDIIAREALIANFRAWLDPFWQRALDYIATPDEALRKKVDAYRLLAVNEGWNWRMVDAYGHGEYLKSRVEECDRKAQGTIAIGYDAAGYLRSGLGGETGK